MRKLWLIIHTDGSGDSRPLQCLRRTKQQAIEDVCNALDAGLPKPTIRSTIDTHAAVEITVDGYDDLWEIWPVETPPLV